MGKNIKTSSTKARAERLISYLEELKARVADIETQYNFLNHNYTQVCEEAILKINDIKIDLEKDEDILVKPDSDVNKMNNLEARFKLGLVAPETYYEHKVNLDDEAELSRPSLQSAVDKTANGIEFALDKLGDGLIYPFVIIANGYNYVKNRIADSGKQ